MEVRYASDSSKRLRWQLGYYSVDVKNRNDAEWHVLGLADLGMVTAIDAPDIYWTTDFRRSYEETAIFGEITYDIADNLTISASMRQFDAESFLDGFSGTVWWPCGGGLVPQHKKPQAFIGRLITMALTVRILTA
jgi:hypothetical protein